MSRIGIVCYSSDGHLLPSMCFASALQQRGHTVIFYTLADGKEKLAASGFPFRIYGEARLPLEKIREVYREVGRAHGLNAVKITVENLCLRASAGLDDLPQLLSSDNLDVLVTDQVVPESSAIATALDIPYVTLCNALPTNPDTNMPPVFAHGMYATSSLARLRIRALNRFMIWLGRRLLGVINEWQSSQTRPRYHCLTELASPFASITQLPQAFDFPRSSVGDNFHYVGPLHQLGIRPTMEFPWNALNDDLPIVYASMGTLQNQLRSVFFKIAEACSGLDVQLVLALGGGADEQEFADLPGKPIVVRYAPQLELLRRASVCITHAGLNTTLEAAACGVPMVALPVTNDQPGVAARIEWSGIGRRLSPRRLRASALRSAVHEVMGQSPQRTRATLMKEEIARLNGPESAAIVTERVAETKSPVTCADLRSAV